MSYRRHSRDYWIAIFAVSVTVNSLRPLTGAETSGKIPDKEIGRSDQNVAVMTFDRDRGTEVRIEDSRTGSPVATLQGKGEIDGIANAYHAIFSADGFYVAYAIGTHLLGAELRLFRLDKDRATAVEVGDPPLDSPKAAKVFYEPVSFSEGKLLFTVFQSGDQRTFHCSYDLAAKKPAQIEKITLASKKSSASSRKIDEKVDAKVHDLLDTNYFHLKPTHAVVLKQWFETKNEWRLATTKDYVAEILEGFAKEGNGFPFYVVGDFNRDHKEDFAVVLAEKTGRRFALAVFNGPFREGSGQHATFFTNAINPQDVMLFKDIGQGKKVLIVGPYATGVGFTLEPTKSGYNLEYPQFD